MSAERDIVAAWLAAYNGRDLDRLLALSEPDFVMDGLAGEQHGHEALRERLTAPMHGVSVHVRALRTWERRGVVVVETISELRYGGAEEPWESMSGAATFTVKGGRVARMRVVPEVGEALGESGFEV